MSIVRRIKREARNSPAKAAVLVGLIGLAFYAWAPLMIAFLTAAEEKVPAAAQSVPKPEGRISSVAETNSPETKEAPEKRPTWRELEQWREESPWTASAELAAIRNPFRLAPAVREAAETTNEIVEEPQTGPEQALNGIDTQLTSTIVTPSRRVAILDGRAYREGDTVPVEYLGVTWEFELRRVEPNKVTLAWRSLERIVSVPERSRVGRIELATRNRQ